ncbi:MULTISPECIES: DUF3108 domain-containing protein [Comamonas]|uniref:DUF3108 domain-containing protein n=1 Tax=Comamonas TaxID=283 RepID=UPI00050F6193|nr:MULTISPECIES: DUF3108 domain-containing protein [Comamonas]KGG91394.1 hypothetical protein P369_12575 [Comamonas thiooxydans]KGG97007.1 hypothetical protein P367_17785 [Comamonas thiooxydans]KGH05528.1 hypothetical protein P365_09785 [Comamonas thiooxydans]KGH13394.1 hypothetical protein P368_09435 [Comamonas thiooxydans]TZG11539.1 DUF3108 domain-containing protein [Comamonas thiooxydans]
MGRSPQASQARKTLLPITGLVLAAHGLLLWGLPELSPPDKVADDQIVMETRMLQAPPPPPPAPAAPKPAPAPAPKPQASPRAPAPAPVPAPAPDEQESEPNPPPAQEPQTQETPGTEAPANTELPAAAAEPAPEPMAEPPEANGADTARPIQVTPAGSAPLPPDSVLPVTLPNSATLEFNASGQVKGFQYSAGAQLQWQHDGQYYQARQSISMFLLGERAQTSEGLITPKGLQPLNFSDKGRKTQSAAFDVASGKAHYSGGQTDAAIGDGVQDRLSVFLQLSALMAAAPDKYPPGTLIELTTSSARSAVRWQFRVGASEALELPFGGVMALRLDKLPGKSSSDQRGSVWLAPSMQYLPVRIKLTLGQDDFVDLQLRKYLPAPQ